MSRSYKKLPVITDSNTNHRYQPSNKAIANRVLRKRLKFEIQKFNQDDSNTVPSQKKSTFKKYYPSYDICDYRFDLRDLNKSELAGIPEDSIRKYYQK